MSDRSDASEPMAGLTTPQRNELRQMLRERRSLRRRRRRRRAFIRSVYFLPSMATLGNLICGFAAIYVATLTPWARDDPNRALADPWAVFFSDHRFVVACYLIFIAMLFDAIDGQLARFTRHTTDFGGQLDSLCDVVSFGVAPAIIVLHTFKMDAPDLPLLLTRLVWAVAALYAACAAIRLARFNVENDHGEQHHYSFLGLPSPGAAATVVAFVLLQREFSVLANAGGAWVVPFYVVTALMPVIVLATGLLMVSTIRYPHFTNRYLRGRRSPARLLTALVLVLLLVVAHRYTLAVGTLIYAFWGVTSFTWFRVRRRLGFGPGLPDPARPG